MPDQVEDRIAGRKMAEEFIPMIESEVSRFGDAGRFGFWGRIAKQFCDQLAIHFPSREERRNNPQPMSDKAAAEFGRTIFPFGKHRGESIDDMPLSYLAMLVNDSEFKQQIRRYLASPRIRRELEAESDPTEDLWGEE